MAVEPYRPLELMEKGDFTKSEFNDFVAVWENFVPQPLCNRIIKYSDHVLDTGSYPSNYLDNESCDDAPVYKSKEIYGGELNRKDFAFCLNYANRNLEIEVQAVLNSCISHYTSHYGALARIPLISTDIKAQITPPGGGYHLWHYENTGIQHAMREIVWMIYLNDMPEGEAETEFLYQKRRIRPTAGTVVMWPAGYTHTHKGNTVFTKNKYILTGWYIKAQ
jgi:hypothetical protein